jgi:hypothetical protein
MRAFRMHIFMNVTAAFDSTASVAGCIRAYVHNDVSSISDMSNFNSGCHLYVV